MNASKPLVGGPSAIRFTNASGAQGPIGDLHMNASGPKGPLGDPSQNVRLCPLVINTRMVQRSESRIHSPKSGARRRVHGPAYRVHSAERGTARYKVKVQSTNPSASQVGAPFSLRPGDSSAPKGGVIHPCLHGDGKSH